ncbi:tubulin polyglutamylase TTLL7-like isoform X1 [Haliotis cracherodii]|uniref:tubulin polyglutamylase TTLL7-like isoform X1 n=1 Tax=Haliotis cracherodii TaxID=6455 RepID=UPI0039EA170F
MSGMRPSISMSSLSSMDRGDVGISSIPPHMQKTSGLHIQQYDRDDGNIDLYPNNGNRGDRGDRGGGSGNAAKKKRKKRHLVTANLSGTRYEVVRQMVEKLGFTASRDDDPLSYILWNDSFVSTERVSELKPYQKLNHFPGMGEVTRKDALARNFLKIQKSFPEDYNFVPRTWILPTDYSTLQNYAKELKAKKKLKTFIVKPSNGAQGHGICLYRNAEKIPPTEHFIVQEYIDKPLLLDGYKFDLRVYVLVTSCDPLRIFLFNDGLVRLGTEKYLPPHDSNINHLYMHLTNYSVNKHNQFYDKSASVDTGSKRSIRYFNDFLRRNDIDVALLWRNISDMIVKTMLVAQPHVLHSYRMCRPGAATGSDSVCFEILGFDVMIDRKLRPWLLEINRSPSFGTDEKIDYDIKSGLVEDTLRLLNIKSSDKRRNIAAQKAEARKRLFRSTKKVEVDVTDLEKKRQTIERRKEELRELLSRIRRAATREEYENRNCGRFRRIFPSDDRARQEKYCSLLSSCFTVFLAGRGSSMQKEIQTTYNNRLREEEIMDMLAECEADEKEGRVFTNPGSSRPRGPKPLQSMPESIPAPRDELDDDDEDELSDSASPPSSTVPRRRSAHTPPRPSSRPDSVHSNRSSRPTSGVLRMTQRPSSNTSLPGAQQRSKSLSRAATSNKLTIMQRNGIDDNFLSSMVKEREEELTKKTLSSLNEMRIKFPGKTDLEADTLLDKLNENWKFHKPRIASYWLVKLDSIKRRKVTDIVRSNVKAVLQRIWRCSDVDNLRLYRIFSRVFNRLLWSHGQGLWNCFSATGNSWETIFNKSSENISDAEMNCCRRIVQLCRDCLLIVYQFAAEAKSTSQTAPSSESEEPPTAPPPTSNGFLASRDMKPPATWNPHTFSQRYSKLYNRAEGMGS